jgi:riboflavin synthase
MFTGLVQGAGIVSAINEHESSVEINFKVGQLINQVNVGDSISINGVCLTVTKAFDDEISVDVMTQTLRLTTMGLLRVADTTNVELAVLPTTRLGGHLVQGHIDGVGSVIAREAGDRWERFVVSVPEHLMKYVVAQGSITIDGVSLTVGSIDDDSSQIELWLIPETLGKTVFGTRKVGDLINIEVDVLAKYVERLITRGEHT